MRIWHRSAPPGGTAIEVSSFEDTITISRVMEGFLLTLPFVGAAARAALDRGAMVARTLPLVVDAGDPLLVEHHPLDVSVAIRLSAAHSDHRGPTLIAGLVHGRARTPLAPPARVYGLALAAILDAVESYGDARDGAADSARRAV